MPVSANSPDRPILWPLRFIADDHIIPFTYRANELCDAILQQLVQPLLRYCTFGGTRARFFFIYFSFYIFRFLAELFDTVFNRNTVTLTNKSITASKFTAYIIKREQIKKTVEKLQHRPSAYIMYFVR